MPHRAPVVEDAPQPRRAPAPAVAPEELPGFGRHLAISVAAATSVVLALVTLGMVAAGTTFVDALAIGALAALWGGGGFGAMLGGVSFIHRADRPPLARSPVGDEGRAS